MTAPLRLHYAPDNASLIVRLALEELGLPYEALLVDRQAKAQQSEAYLRLNPNGTIPVLETPHGAMFETAAILLWLADRHDALAPGVQDPLRAPFLKWLFWTSNTLHIDLRQTFYPEKFIGADTAHQAQLRAVLRQRLSAHLSMLDEGLSATPGLAGGANATLLDLYLPCLIRWTQLYAQTPEAPWFDLTLYPTLHHICAHAETRESTQAAQTAEGLGATPFTSPTLATPPEGSAT